MNVVDRSKEKNVLSRLEQRAAIMFETKIVQFRSLDGTLIPRLFLSVDGVEGVRAART